jgi:hypothetical protein
MMTRATTHSPFRENSEASGAAASVGLVAVEAAETAIDDGGDTTGCKVVCDEWDKGT